MNRRHLLALAPVALLKAAPPAINQPPEIVLEAVGVAHANLTRLKQLVDAHPSLAEAAVDWGFGDWETALGAASHMGNREIAEYLLSRGAAPTLFSATMLGQLDVVKAMVAARPGVQRIPGPHSIRLLAHARAGGKQAEPVLHYLESLGDAGAPATPPISEADLNALTGDYTYSEGKLLVAITRGQLTIQSPGRTARGLFHLGEMTFHPAGAEAVRIRFAKGTLTISDPDPIVTATHQ